MPRPRFAKLPGEKRQRILEAAAKAFTAFGYTNASLHKILEEAGISKGAAYYYFDDKADLYATTLLYYMEEVLANIPFDPVRLTAENFWAEVAALYRHQFTHYYARPWVLGIAKSGGPVALDTLAEGPMAALWQAQHCLMTTIAPSPLAVNAQRMKGQ